MGSKIQRPITSLTIFPQVEWLPVVDPVVENRHSSKPVITYKPNKDLIVMLNAAESGLWNIVFEVLDKQPILVNQIPRDKEWSVLHWAAYQNNYNAVSRLFKYSNCDTSISTNKSSNSEATVTYKPVELTQLPDLESLLKNQFTSQRDLSLNHPNLISPKHKDRAVSYCIKTAFYQYDGVFFSKLLDLNKASFISLMDEIYSFINVEDNWEVAMDSLSSTVSQFHSEIGHNILYGTDDNLESKNLFFYELIKQFIQERHCLYHLLNSIVCRSENDVITDDYVMALAPYALVLNSIILNWTDLKSFRARTYLIARDEYVVGDTFVWFSFVLCYSSEPDLPENTPAGDKYSVIEIDNGNSWKWSPKYIGAISESEFEYLYPFGAKFTVTAKSNDKVYLKLLNF